MEDEEQLQHLPAEPRARNPQPYELSPLNVPTIIAPSLHEQQPRPAGVIAVSMLSPSAWAMFSVEQRLATDDVDIEAFDEDAARRLKTSRERACLSWD
jgi:hypothetical protein